MERKVMA